MCVRVGFDVNRNHLCSRFYKRFDVTSRLDNHQMRIDRQLGCTRNRLHHWQTDRDVWHKAAVHHIDMKQRCPCALDRFDLFAEPAKVGGKNRWGDLNHKLSERLRRRRGDRRTTVAIRIAGAI